MGDQARRVTALELDKYRPLGTIGKSLNSISPVEPHTLQPGVGRRAQQGRDGSELRQDESRETGPELELRVLSRADVLEGRLRSNLVVRADGPDDPRVRSRLLHPGDVLVTTDDAAGLASWIPDHQSIPGPRSVVVGPGVMGLRIVGGWIEAATLASLLDLEPSGGRNALWDLVLPEVALENPEPLARFIAEVTERRYSAKTELDAWNEVLEVLGDLPPLITRSA